jgi:hypothetical protein
VAILIRLNTRTCGARSESVRKSGTADVASVNMTDNFARTWLIHDGQVLPKVLDKDLIEIIAESLPVSGRYF